MEEFSLLTNIHISYRGEQVMGHETPQHSHQQCLLSKEQKALKSTTYILVICFSLILQDIHKAEKQDMLVFPVSTLSGHSRTYVSYVFKLIVGPTTFNVTVNEHFHRSVQHMLYHCSAGRENDDAITLQWLYLGGLHNMAGIRNLTHLTKTSPVSYFILVLHMKK